MKKKSLPSKGNRKLVPHRSSKMKKKVEMINEIRFLILTLALLMKDLNRFLKELHKALRLVRKIIFAVLAIIALLSSVL